ncbi:peptide chain release factor N(5)-glutamine methyltransferase [bacterium]|nr:peptide chain release factor N(5)-glutamine methyltransferase [bacterium]
MTVGAAKKTWNVSELLGWSIHYLSEKQFDNPRLNAEWLLCHTLKCKRIDLYAHYDRPMVKKELEAFKALLLRRINHEPLQYIIGTTEFMGLTFEVNPDVLIPRPDTELLVEKTLDLCKHNYDEKVYILDIGTGSGALCVSLAFFLEKYNIPFSITALDISEKALALAKHNADRIVGEGKIKFFLGNILDEDSHSDLFQSFDIIVSNPPYISDHEFALLPKEVKDYEPEIALKADAAGLVFYKHVARAAKLFFRSNLTKKHVIFEVGYNQSEQVKKILAGSGFEIEVYKDYHQIDRVVCGSLQVEN